ncbi:MAG: hypothetical protein AAF940_01635 [Pseudomonadota bacterium]
MLFRKQKRSSKNTDIIDLTAQFKLFAPNSSGQKDARNAVTARTIRDTIPMLADFAEELAEEAINVQPIELFAESATAHGGDADLLKSCLDRHGSDKAQTHAYHLVYAPMLSDRDAVRAVVEIGVGSNNSDVVSALPAHQTPGASLRAFRDYCPGAMVFGADVDPRILFSEDRIMTYYVDQRDPKSLAELARKVPDDIDLIIDDGLHSPDANLAVLRFGMEKVRVGGWIAIEDINPAAASFWRLVSRLLPANFAPAFLKGRHGMMFAVKRVA